MNLHIDIVLMLIILYLPLDQVYNIYNTRADAENRIKELKYDFGLE